MYIRRFNESLDIKEQLEDIFTEIEDNSNSVKIYRGIAIPYRKDLCGCIYRNGFTVVDSATKKFKAIIVEVIRKHDDSYILGNINQIKKRIPKSIYLYGITKVLSGRSSGLNPVFEVKYTFAFIY